jgi:hypothetical protein
MAAGGGDILRIVEEVQTREIKKEIAIAGKKDNFIEVEDERHALWSKPTVSIQAGHRGPLLDPYQGFLARRCARASFLY